MNIYNPTYREIKRIYKFGKSNVTLKRELLLYEDELNKKRTYVFKSSDANITNNIELTEQEFYEIILKVMQDNKIENTSQLNDFLQINYNESIEQTIERV